MQRTRLLLFCAALTVLSGMSRTPEPEAAPAETAIETKEIDVSTLFADAPEAVQAVAAQIAAGEAPDVGSLAALGADLDRSWAAPEPKNAPSFGHTLLREAVLSRNIDAARALVAAGADPFFNNSEMAFLAMTYEDNEWRVWFPDYRPGMAFLDLWLEAGGDPTVRHAFYSPTGDLLTATPQNNLEGILRLLEAGANPWARHAPPDARPGDDFRYGSFFNSLANANLMSNEVAFRIAEAGHYAGGPAEEVTALLEEYQATAEQYVGISGPEGEALVWGMQMALRPILEQLGVVPEGAIAELLAMDIPSDAGGFFLAPGEIRSPDDEDQRVNNDNQVGNETWHAR